MNNVSMPAWASEIISSYESGAAGCFVLHGNVNDRLLVPSQKGAELGGVQEFIMESLLPRFDVVLSYDPGQGLRVERGGETFFHNGLHSRMVWTYRMSLWRQCVY